MKRLYAPALALLLACGIATPSSARATNDELRYEPWPHVAVTTGIGLLLAADFAARGALAPESCGWCSTNAFDLGLTESLAWENHELATTFSDIGLVLLPASAIVYGFAADGAEAGAIDALVFLETFSATFVATELVKFAVARERPILVFLGKDEPKIAGNPDDWYVSFPSGHASVTFASVAAAATIADLRGRDPTPIWLAGLPIAASVAYFRVAGYHHWTTDVLAGAALGTAFGIAMPRLLHGGGQPASTDDAAGERPVQIFQLGGGVW